MIVTTPVQSKKEKDDCHKNQKFRSSESIVDACNITKQHAAGNTFNKSKLGKKKKTHPKFKPLTCDFTVNSIHNHLPSLRIIDKYKTLKNKITSNHTLFNYRTRNDNTLGGWGGRRRKTGLKVSKHTFE